MKLNVFVTLILRTVLLLASVSSAWADSSANTQSVSTTTLPQQSQAQPPPQNFHLKFNVARSTNLVDFQDGSRGDSVDYELTPSIKIPWGALAASITYSQDLRDQYSKTASDFGDVPLIWALKPTDLKWPGQTAKISYSIVAIFPVSQKSVKRDELKTALGAKIRFSVEPEGGDGFSYGAAVSLNQNFHSYEEDINGAVLNKYSSVQSASLGYSYSDWSLSFDAINRTKVTYQSNVKSAFELTEELGYGINKNISLALGHTNAGSPLKPNGTDSNVELINENTSTVYASLILTY